MGSAAADDSGVAIGTVLAGRYRIAGVLGSGGMGRVYRGEHTAMGKPVAVKVLHAALGRNKEAAIRFQREAVASGRLDHPNIVSVIDFGVLDDGCLYLVMEALDGEHLGQRLAREKRVQWSEALLIMRGVLLGLRHAHDRGVVHRDIKPDNIFLADKDGEAIVKVLDFGIAKLYAGNTEDQTATRSGITVGTPAYLSPEQAVGGAITPASDIYSSSIVLYEMLVGRTPFDSADPMTLLTSHVGTEPPTFRDIAPELELPDGIESLVRHGLAKFSADRIGTIEYLQQIDEVLRAHGFEVAPAPPVARASQSIGIPVGPFASPTPAPGAPLPGMITPSPSFMSTPAPFPVVARAPTPVPARRASEPKLAREPTEPAPRQHSARRTWIALGAVALVAGIAAVLLLAVGARAGHDGPVANGPPASVLPTLPSVQRPAADDHEAQLGSALHDLQDGATCPDRKKALAKLVELGDAKAVPAIKKARARGKPNACLRAAADQALKTLSSRI